MDGTQTVITTPIECDFGGNGNEDVLHIFKYPELEHPFRMQLSVISRILFKRVGFNLFKGAVGVFYNPSRQVNNMINILYEV